MLTKLIDDVVTWGYDKGILLDPCAKTQALKTVSEVGEFADNIATVSYTHLTLPTNREV